MAAIFGQFPANFRFSGALYVGERDSRSVYNFKSLFTLLLSLARP